MNRKVVLGCVLVLAAGVSAGCATSDAYAPSASPGWVGPPITTDTPSIDNADAAGPASVPGVHSGTAPAVIAPSPAASAPVLVDPPAQPSPVIVVPR
jgi:hypothetical protein